MSYQIRKEKDMIWWQNRIKERGLNYQINIDGRDKNIIVDDRGDPFFQPKRKSP
jgi:hypothetical protein